MNTEVPKADKTDIISHIVADNKDNSSTIEEAPKIDEIKPVKEELFKDVVTEPDKAIIPQKIPDKPMMTPEEAAYPKLKKIKAELDNQNNFIFQAEQQRGNLEIELSDLKGLAKITRKAELQRKIDEKSDYINRLKIGLSNMVRNYGFENMNEFYLSCKESKNAYEKYQKEVDIWKKGYGDSEIISNKTGTISDKMDRMQKEAGNIRRFNKEKYDRGAR